MDLEEIQHKQPILNIGMLGHVSNGKSTLTKAITGVKTQRFASEQKRNITEKLGYANGKIWKCDDCSPPQCFFATASNLMKARCKCGTEGKLLVHVSFVDSPGHNQLMATMLNGACVMDTSILIESANNDTIPAQQTLEHLIASDMVGIKTDLVCINKVDLVDRDTVVSNIDKLKQYIDDVPIVPISANYGWNIDVVCEQISKIKIPQKDYKSGLEMTIVRTFDINKGNSSIEDLKGGIIGGSIKKGVLKKGDKIEIIPGFIEKDDDSFRYKPLTAYVLSINSEKNNLDFAIPGGLIGVQLSLDPAFTVGDRLIGNTARSFSRREEYTGKVYDSIVIKYQKINSNVISDKIDTKLKEKHIVKINSNSSNVDALVTKREKIKNESGKSILITLKMISKPIYADIGDKIPVSKNSMGSRLIGMGIIVSGQESSLF